MGVGRGVAAVGCWSCGGGEGSGEVMIFFNINSIGQRGFLDFSFFGGGGEGGFFSPLGFFRSLSLLIF